MEPTIRPRPAFDVAGLQIRTLPMSPEIAALWPRFVQRIGELVHATAPRVTYGVMREVTGPPRGLDYLAGVAVSTKSGLPEGMVVRTLPAAEDAVFRTPFGQLAAAYGTIFERWLPASGYVQAGDVLFERYGEDFDPQDPASPVEVHVPVRRR